MQDGASDNGDSSEEIERGEKGSRGSLISGGGDGLRGGGGSVCVVNPDARVCVCARARGVSGCDGSFGDGLKPVIKTKISKISALICLLCK